MVRFLWGPHERKWRWQVSCFLSNPPVICMAWFCLGSVYAVFSGHNPKLPPVPALGMICEHHGGSPWALCASLSSLEGSRLVWEMRGSVNAIQGHIKGSQGQASALPAFRVWKLRFPRPQPWPQPCFHLSRDRGQVSLLSGPRFPRLSTQEQNTFQRVNVYTGVMTSTWAPFLSVPKAFATPCDVAQ